MLTITRDDIGKLFRRRDGKLVTVTHLDLDDYRDSVVKTEGPLSDRNAYGLNGRYYSESTEDERDLVERFYQIPTPDTAPVGDTTLWDKIYAQAVDTIMFHNHQHALQITEEYADEVARAAKLIADRAIVQKDN
jgi:hypothetical protein